MRSIYISDDLFGFEVNYTASKIPSQIEECHGEHELGLGWEIELTEVFPMVNDQFVIFLGTENREKLNLLDLLSETQKDEIIKRIHEEIID